MYLQVFRIFPMQLQELEVIATRPCDTLAQLLLLWIKGSVTTANLLLALGKLVELCIHGGVVHPISLLWKRQVVSH